MKRSLLTVLLFYFLTIANARNKYQAFQAGIELGVSATTIQKYYDYFGFFDDLYYGKDYNGTAGIFVNRFLHPNYQMELGFYFTSKGTRYRFESKTSTTRGTYGTSEELYYLEIPILLYYYPDERNQFSYRYGISVAYHLIDSFYKEYDISLSLGIRFKPFSKGFFKNDLCILKADCSILPISIPQEIEEYNYSQLRFYKMNQIQRNMGITFSIQHYLTR
ncbi:MAG: outer membrane beta-barrel protein [Prolixibacteraceae bacterium]